MANDTITVPTDIINDRPVKPWENYYSSVEVPGSRQLRVNAKGVTGSWQARKFPYKWVEEGIPSGALGQSGVMPVIGGLLPKQGDSWSLTYSYCRCEDISFEEKENGMCEATINYTSEGFTGDMQLDISTDEQIYRKPYYMKWEIDATSDNNPYVETIEAKEPILNYNVTYKLDYISSLTPKYRADYIGFAKYARQAFNSINEDTWHTFAPETVLCTGLTMTPEFALDGQLLFITIEANFKVRIISSWNYMWKDPTPEKTSKGADLHWHQLPNQPFPEGAFYTTDPNKIGKAIFTGDVTITNNQDGSITVNEVTPEPEHGGFYKPYKDINSVRTYYYTPVNFSAITGIPNIV